MNDDRAIGILRQPETGVKSGLLQSRSTLLLVLLGFVAFLGGVACSLATTALPIPSTAIPMRTAVDASASPSATWPSENLFTATPRILSTATARPSVLSQPNGIELHSQSMTAIQGTADPFCLDTHCGVDYAGDFDGSFWDLDDPTSGTTNGDRPPVIGNSFQDGTITIVDADHARFDLSGGRIEYQRHQGAKVVPGLRACGWNIPCREYAYDSIGRF